MEWAVPSSSTGSFVTTAPAVIRPFFLPTRPPNSATIRSEVLSTGGENLEVTFFWGDNNASNIPGDWDNNYTLNGTHGVGLLTHSISGLTAGTTYYFTVRASNTAGDALATVRSFLATSNDPQRYIFPVGSLSMDENLNIGSVVVDFNATDPDPNPILSFALVDQNSSTQNSLFTLIQMEFFEPRRLLIMKPMPPPTLFGFV